MCPPAFLCTRRTDRQRERKPRRCSRAVTKSRPCFSGGGGPLAVEGAGQRHSSLRDNAPSDAPRHLSRSRESLISRPCFSGGGGPLAVEGARQRHLSLRDNALSVASRQLPRSRERLNTFPLSPREIGGASLAAAYLFPAYQKKQRIHLCIPPRTKPKRSRRLPPRPQFSILHSSFSIHSRGASRTVTDHRPA